MPLPLHRVLIVEDSPSYRDRLAEHIGELVDIAVVDFVASRREALDAIRTKRYHLISLDQNIPGDEGESPSIETSYQLCADIRAISPITQIIFLTLEGDINYASRLGLFGVEFWEKGEVGDRLPRITPQEFLKTVVRPRLERHTSWAMSHATPHVPAVIANACAGLVATVPDRQLRASDTRGSSMTMGGLWESVLWLQWARTCALAWHAGRTAILKEHRPSDRAKPAQKLIFDLWEDLNASGWFSDWRRFLESMSPGAEAAWIEVNQAAAETLGGFRNTAMHMGDPLGLFGFGAYEPSLQIWFESVAYWADAPLMLNPQFHPRDRDQLTFSNVADPGWLGVKSIRTRASIPRADGPGEVIYGLHRGPHGDVLVSMFPFISLTRVPGQYPEPTLLRPGGKSQVERLSLWDGRPFGEQSLTTAERAAWEAMFRALPPAHEPALSTPESRRNAQT